MRKQGRGKYRGVSKTFSSGTDSILKGESRTIFIRGRIAKFASLFHENLPYEFS
jgi:hypothetical protein